MKHLFAISIVLLFTFKLMGQDLENLKDQKPFKFNGGINLSLNTYSTNRDRPSRDGFLWTLSGSPTLSIYGIAMPFSFVLSKRNEEFRQPFNQYGASPYYKWIKLHLGYRNLTFSDYSLNGHQFLGVGAELTPGNWRLGAMYGRLLRPISPDPLAIVPIQPAYLRRGYSVKVGYGTASNFLDLVVFKGWDDPGSIERSLDSASINPQQNLVLGVKTQQRLFKSLTFNMDIGLSGWTSNIFAGGSSADAYPLQGVINSLLDVNYSTQFLKAGKASLSYRIGGINLRMQYERVEPEYQTMGSYFFNTDQENITLSPSFSLLKRKIRVNASVGWLRNNLFENRVNQTNRRISSLNVSYAPSKSFSINATYNNYQIRQEQIDRIQRDVIDSLQLEQFSNNIGLNANYSFGTKTNRYSLRAGISRQYSDQEQNTEALGDFSSESLTPTLSFNYKDSEAKWGCTIGANYNNFENNSINSVRWGVRSSVNKTFADDKLSMNGSLSYNNTSLDDNKGSNTLSLGLRSSYKAGEKHRLSISTRFVQRNSENERIESYSEFIGNVSYGFTF